MVSGALKQIAATSTMAPQQTTPTILTLSTHGRTEIPHPAERAVINVAVASQGANKAAVSENVVTTAQHIERLLRELSPSDTTPETKDAAPLAHWSKTGLSATSFMPYMPPNSKAPQKAREYNARITFDIRFKKFKELGAFGTKLSALPHVEVSHIDWILTTATQKSYQSQLRKSATRDALEKARDYCEVLGCSNLRPVGLHEGNVATGMSGGGGGLFRNGCGGGLFGSTSQAAQQSMQSAPGMNANGGSDARDESPLEFTPKEVRMAMEVTIKFCAESVRTLISSLSSQLIRTKHADNSIANSPGVMASPRTTSANLAKRARTSQEMEGKADWPDQDRAAARMEQ